MCVTACRRSLTGPNFSRSTCTEVHSVVRVQVAAKWDGTGKVMVITGAAGGLGAEATRVLAGRGATGAYEARLHGQGQHKR